MIFKTKTRKRLDEALRILNEARHAIRKINVERARGVGYRHAEVEWLLAEEENIKTLLDGGLPQDKRES